ncbi:hypothetical protein [Sigmofec virus UA08Rod_4822]|uniref:Uncharacterized protein n=1 Tax=Sigmofec virus UA08Rod_4822 TaxID=2929411 RepID=A0A976N1M9_9VIRU|nr:hypothetical protein [Sigmofec virus UA08Rod_4822]
MRQSTESPEPLNTQDRPAVTVSESTPQPSSASSEDNQASLINGQDTTVEHRVYKGWDIIHLIQSDRQRYHVVAGPFLLSRALNTYEEVVEEIEEQQPQLITALIHAVLLSQASANGVTDSTYNGVNKSVNDSVNG